ncbi:MAG TPA: sialidase family protein [Pyrinomonadaceae bacterium]|nr:sialidase family protein [Pyrinomonadaceae bacterium]
MKNSVRDNSQVRKTKKPLKAAIFSSLGAAALLLTTLFAPLPSASAAAAEANPCLVPGSTVLTDPAGDQTGAPENASMDIQSVSVGEDYAESDMLVVKLKVGSLSTLPVNGIWRVAFAGPDGKAYFVNMATDTAGAVSYAYGETTTTNTTLGSAENGTYTPEGLITIHVSTNKVGSPAGGQALTKVTGRTQILVGAAGTGALATIDSADTTPAGQAAYTLAGKADACVGGGTAPPVSTAVPPTYSVFAAPAGMGNGAGEPTIGHNWKTGNSMFIAGLQTLRVSFDDGGAQATASWVNKSAPQTARVTFDPILYTDSGTGRTFVSQLLPTKVSLMAFTDDDGETWTPSQGSGINSGVDHQTVGGGPYKANVKDKITGLPVGPRSSYPNAVYYASQDIGLAEIARSDDGGMTYGVAVPMYDITECGGLHGQIKVAGDGTVYVPNKACGGKQAVLVSEDNGQTWDIRTVPQSTEGRTDPSVGVATDGTIYFGYANGDGKPRVAVSRDKGKTWENDQNVGYYEGIRNTVFPAVAAGDPDRAAFFFLGTSTSGNGTGSEVTFTGAWYGYVSTTYDGGKTWVTVNATPGDPVQRGSICTNGTTCPSDPKDTRNLLDFNDMEVDAKGRAVAAFADGCTSANCVAGRDVNNDGKVNSLDNDGTEKATIIRQATGKGLFAAYDPPSVVTTTAVEDDDARVAYSNGWHLGQSAQGTAGHYRFNNGADPTHFARLVFDVTGDSGAVTYHYARSTRGGAAEVVIDGVPQGVVSYRGAAGSLKSPEFGHSFRVAGLTPGRHTLELRSLDGVVYVDGFTLESASTAERPFSGPGTTSNGAGALSVGRESVTAFNVAPGTQAVSVMAESNAPIRLLLIDPKGLTVAVADNSRGGVAVINKAGTGAGTYQIKVVNLSAGPVEFWTAATPLVTR